MPVHAVMQEVIAVRTAVIDEALLQWAKAGITQVGLNDTSWIKLLAPPCPIAFYLYRSSSLHRGLTRVLGGYVGQPESVSTRLTVP